MEREGSGRLRYQVMSRSPEDTEDWLSDTYETRAESEQYLEGCLAGERACPTGTRYWIREHRLEWIEGFGERPEGQKR